jgi:hypothetical protein
MYWLWLWQLEQALSDCLGVKHRALFANGDVALMASAVIVAYKLFPLNYLPYLFEQNAVVVEFI